MYNRFQLDGVREVCVLLCFIEPILGNRYGPGVSLRASQWGTHPRLKIADLPPHPVLPPTTWGGRILTLHPSSNQVI